LKNSFCFLLFLSLFGFWTGNLPAQALEEATIARMRAIMETEARSEHFSGVVLVAHKDRILLNEGYGYADIENRQPLTEDSKFMIASVSKAFTAACILKLEEEGKIDVNDPINKYLPDYPEWAGSEITVHQLLTHTSGIPDYINDFPLAFRIKRFLNWHPSREKLVASFKNKELNFEPGTNYDYSNSGYVLLALIVERVSGMEFNLYLKKHILEPVRMINTGTTSFDGVNGGAVAYGGKNYDPKPLKNFRTEYIFGMGGLYSTSKDLYKWMYSLNEGALLNDGEKEKMFTPHKHGYGYGWEVTEDEGKLIYSHGGYFPGWNSWVQIYPDDSLYMVVLSNQDRSMPFWVVRELANIWFTNQDSDTLTKEGTEMAVAFPLSGKYIQSYGSEIDNAEDAYGLSEIIVVNQNELGLSVKCSNEKCWTFEKVGPESWKESVGLFRLDFEDVNGTGMVSVTDGSRTWHWTRVGN
jgi:CubicO group peptidase (beta-lactamase class C family)